MGRYQSACILLGFYFEEMCRKVSENDNVWLATNIEIYEYITTVRNLVVSMDGKAEEKREAVKIPAGKTVWL